MEAVGTEARRSNTLANTLERSHQRPVVRETKLRIRSILYRRMYEDANGKQTDCGCRGGAEAYVVLPSQNTTQNMALTRVGGLAGNIRHSSRENSPELNRLGPHEDPALNGGSAPNHSLKVINRLHSIEINIIDKSYREIHVKKLYRNKLYIMQKYIIPSKTPRS